MNYIDLSEHVISSTNILHDVPTDWVQDYLEQQWELYTYGVSINVPENYTHPHIKVVTHCLMALDDIRYHTVCSVLVNNLPAFFYIMGGRYGMGYCTIYALNIDSCKLYITYLAEMVVDTYYRHTGFISSYLPPVTIEDITNNEDTYIITATEDVPHLTKWGKVRYGQRWSRDNPERLWVPVTP